MFIFLVLRTSKTAILSIFASYNQTQHDIQQDAKQKQITKHAQLASMLVAARRQECLLALSSQ